MRCLTLGGALRRRGVQPRFFVNDGAAAHVPALMKEAWQSVPADPEAAAAMIAGSGGVDVLVVDHYRLGAREERQLAGTAAVVVIDDLADRPHDCAILIDQTFGRSPADYRSLLSDRAECLVGSSYAMLRPEFAAARPASLARRRAAAPARRVLVSMGLTDVGGNTLQLVEALDGVDLHLDVLVAASAPSYAALAERASNDPRLRLHAPGSNMADLMMETDIAIGAAGSTAWERCCLGLPTVMLVLADNQRKIAQNLAAKGAAVVTSSVAEAGTAIARLARDSTQLRAMSRLASEVTDGLGADRVASRIMAL